jgi:hypothetical protein
MSLGLGLDFDEAAATGAAFLTSASLGRLSVRAEVRARVTGSAAI